MSRLRRLTAWTIALTVVLITLGGIVRATGAGLACPDWPLCHGRLIPPLAGPILVEYSHRLAASVVGVLTLILAAHVWRFHRRDAALLRTALLATALLGVQVILGGLTVRTALTAGLVAAHLGTAMAFLATLLLLYAAVWQSEQAPIIAPPRLRVAATLAAGVTLAQIALGGYVSASGAGLACPDFPLCRGSLVPPLAEGVLIQLLHRMGALVVAGLVVALMVQARQSVAPVRRLAAAAAALVIVQIGLGALNIFTRVAPPITVLHLLTATMLFGTLVAIAGLVWPAQAVSAQPPRWRQAAGDYLALTKPRIILLLLGTTAATMVVAAGGRLPLALLAATLLGGALAAGAANAINMYWDRDVDAVMQRTRRRPVPAGRIPPGRALSFGLLLAVSSVAILGWLVNWLSAGLAFAGILYYVLVYTIWLKRSTPQNIVIGGAAGAVPPLVGWAAVTGHVALPAVVLFAIIFLWTPPHFWALALVRRQEYAMAGIPMLPVVAGPEATRRQIVRYSLALVAVTLLLGPFGGAGAVYLVAAVLLGAGFIHLALAIGREDSTRPAVRLFGYSIAYLALLFTAMVVDRIV